MQKKNQPTKQTQKTKKSVIDRVSYSIEHNF